MFKQLITTHYWCVTSNRAVHPLLWSFQCVKSETCFLQRTMRVHLCGWARAVGNDQPLHTHTSPALINVSAHFSKWRQGVPSINEGSWPVTLCSPDFTFAAVRVEEEGLKRGGRVIRSLLTLGIKGDPYLQGGLARLGVRVGRIEFWSPRALQEHVNSVSTTTRFHRSLYCRVTRYCLLDEMWFKFPLKMMQVER